MNHKWRYVFGNNTLLLHVLDSLLFDKWSHNFQDQILSELSQQNSL